MSGARLSSVRLTALFFAILSAPASAQALHSLLKAGDAAFTSGDYITARRAFEKALQSADATSRYEVLKRLTATTAATGQFADAQSYLQQAISALAPNSPKLVNDLILSVSLDLRTKDYDRALATAQHIQAMHTAAYTAESIPVADDFLRIGEIYIAEKQPDKALRPLFSAQGIRTRLTGSLDPGLLPVLDRINEAFASFSGGGNEATYRQALLIRETLYGPNSPELINTVEGLANLYSSASMLEAAEPLYLRLLALWEGMVGKDHPMIAVILDKLVVLYTKAAEPEKARAALARSVAIRARFLAVGLSHQAVDAKPDQARALYARALAALGTPTPANQDVIDQITKALNDLQSHHQDTSKF